MPLTIGELWVAMDKAAIHAIPSLMLCEPEVHVEIWQALLLTAGVEGERLHLLGKYLLKRQRVAQEDGRPSIFRSYGCSRSFSVEYFSASPEHQQLKARIEAQAWAQRQEKKRELRRLKEEYSMWMEKYHGRADCDGHTREQEGIPVWCHSRACLRCEYLNKADSLQIDMHEWPLPQHDLEAQSTVFELSVPAAFSEWRNSTLLPGRAQKLGRFLVCTWRKPEGETPNEVIASQSDCPEYMSLYEYKALAELPYGYNIQWQSILNQLAMPRIDFNKMETAIFLLQMSLQAGPRSLAATKCIHTRLRDHEFGRVMLKNLAKGVTRIRENWEAYTALCSLTFLASRALSQVPGDLISPFIDLIDECRAVSYRWVAIVLEKAQTATEEAHRRVFMHKRSLSIEEDCYPECPFTVCYKTYHQRGHENKKRKSKNRDENKQVQLQKSPFNPEVRFATRISRDIYYTIEPQELWRGMTCYNNFILNQNKYNTESFVYVANELSKENKKAQDHGLMARILEIRALDEVHVYARIYWMYRPEDLPLGTVDGDKKTQGRQPYHGVNELIASNHMDIINVVSIEGLAAVDEWIDSDTNKVPEDLYWRQEFDCRNSQLSSIELICECQEPANPDKIVLKCTNPQCGKSLHEECVSHKILMQVHGRLGLDKPNMSQCLAGKKQEPTATHPLSPPSPEKKETRLTIDVGSSKTYDGLRCKAAHETECEVGSLVGGRTPFG
ncbi:unnamed protein product, partial [Fusarium fujikuroi]